jgi:hypothetical protein
VRRKGRSSGAKATIPARVATASFSAYTLCISAIVVATPSPAQTSSSGTVPPFSPVKLDGSFMSIQRPVTPLPSVRGTSEAQ